jgi:hypothetical protein
MEAYYAILNGKRAAVITAANGDDAWAFAKLLDDRYERLEPAPERIARRD